jgi:photosystem II stability/assembly factor-like uncharacterized protein
MHRASVGAGALLSLLMSLLFLQQMRAAPPIPSLPERRAFVPAMPGDAPASVPTRTAFPECMDGTRLPGLSHPIAFVDPLHGWMQGRVCADGTWRNMLAATQDGGQTWQTVGSPAVAGVLRFANASDGWLLGETPLVTRDGGVTWTEDHQLQNAIALEVADGSVWVIQGRCDSSNQCEYLLLVSSDVGRTWQPAHVQPSIVGYVPRLVRVGSRDAWIVSYAGKAHTHLLATHDGGMTWQDVPTPCSSFQSLPAFAPLDAARLWLLCSGQPGAGNQLKWLYASSDGGREWRRVPDTAWPGSADLGNLPTGGYIRALVVISDQRAFIGLGRNPLWATRDGGQTWDCVVVPNENDAGILGILFVDEQHGWAATQTAIWRTIDGGDTWERIGT